MEPNTVIVGVVVSAVAIGVIEGVGKKIGQDIYDLIKQPTE